MTALSIRGMNWEMGIREQINHVPYKFSVRVDLERLLSLAEGMANQRAFGGEHCERIADSGELLMLEYKEQIRLIENITKEARKAFIEVSLNPDLEIG